MVSGKVKHNNGETTYVIGLSHENLQQLKAGRPISLRPDQYPFMPCDTTILFFGCETETSLLNRLEQAGLKTEETRQAPPEPGTPA